MPDSTLVDHLHGSPNFNKRRGANSSPVAGDVTNVKSAPPNMLLLHYTGMKSCTKAIDWLSRPEANVSCHYVIDVDGTITQMVTEEHRAWHAGAGSWGDDHDINSVSIGIEIHNLGHDLGYCDFPTAQMAKLTQLAKDIVTRNNISPMRVLGHSDIAPLRKGDPGEKFDWAGLAAQGVGTWLEPIGVDDNDEGYKSDDISFSDSGRERDNASDGKSDRTARIKKTRDMLSRFGYGIAPGAQFDETLQKTLLAFQRHYRPARCDGCLDRSTLGTLAQYLKASAPLTA